MNSITPQHILCLYRNVLTSWAASSLFLHNTQCLSLRNGFIILPNGHPAQNWPRPGGDQFNSSSPVRLLSVTSYSSIREFSAALVSWCPGSLNKCQVQSRAGHESERERKCNKPVPPNLHPPSHAFVPNLPLLSARWPLNLETSINGFLI